MTNCPMPFPKRKASNSMSTRHAGSGACGGNLGCARRRARRRTARHQTMNARPRGRRQRLPSCAAGAAIVRPAPARRRATALRMPLRPQARRSPAAPIGPRTDEMRPEMSGGDRERAGGDECPEDQPDRPRFTTCETANRLPRFKGLERGSHAPLVPPGSLMRTRARADESGSPFILAFVVAVWHAPRSRWKGIRHESSRAGPRARLPDHLHFR